MHPKCSCREYLLAFGLTLHGAFGYLKTARLKFGMSGGFCSVAFIATLLKHVSHEKNPSYFPLYWLVNRDI